MSASDNAIYTTPTDLLSRIGELKSSVDFLMRQLCEGEYLYTDTFANNWVHLSLLYESIQETMNDRKLMDLIVRTDILLAADLLATGRMIQVVSNFLRCAENAGHRRLNL
jgi:hypothetical protein